jgi:hypothetical protein
MSLPPLDLLVQSTIRYSWLVETLIAMQNKAVGRIVAMAKTGCRNRHRHHLSRLWPACTEGRWHIAVGCQPPRMDRATGEEPLPMQASFSDILGRRSLYFPSSQ